MDQIHTILIIVCLSYTQNSNWSQVSQFHIKIGRKKLQDVNKWDAPKIEPQQMDAFTCGQKLDSAL